MPFASPTQFQRSSGGDEYLYSGSLPCQSSVGRPCGQPTADLSWEAGLSLGTTIRSYNLREKVNVKFQFDFTENVGMITNQSHSAANLLHFGSKLSNV